MNKLIKALSFLALAGATQQAAAVSMDFDFSGNFIQDNDIALLDFTVASDSNVTIFSSSWDDGGFDPILAVWDNGGNLVHEQDDGNNVGSTLSNGISYDHGEWDSYFDVSLTAGDYTASIAQYDNFAVSNILTDGFTYDGDPNFTATALGGCSNGEFCGVGTIDDNRTSDWAFHILNVDSASQQGSGTVPEPSTLAILGLGLAGLVMQARRGRKATAK